VGSSALQNTPPSSRGGCFALGPPLTPSTRDDRIYVSEPEATADTVAIQFPWAQRLQFLLLNHQIFIPLSLSLCLALSLFKFEAQKFKNRYCISHNLGLQQKIPQQDTASRNVITNHKNHQKSRRISIYTVYPSIFLSSH
jgi:hypothetical protein